MFTAIGVNKSKHTSIGSVYCLPWPKNFKRRCETMPGLNEIPMNKIFDGSVVIITMSTGQWDGSLEAAYDYGHTLLELDENEIPVKAYRKPQLPGGVRTAIRGAV